MSHIERLLHPCDRTIDQKSAVLGALAGAATGGLLTTLLMTVGVLPLNAPELPDAWPHAALMAFAVFVWSDIISTFAWGFGILIVAAPAWAILNAIGVRCWLAAMLLGAILAPAPFILVAVKDILSLTSFSLAGALTGLVIWLIAYRAPPRASVAAVA